MLTLVPFLFLTAAASLTVASPTGRSSKLQRIKLTKRSSILDNPTGVINPSALQRTLSRSVAKIISSAGTYANNTGTSIDGFSAPSPASLQKRWFGVEPLIDEQNEVLWAGTIQIGIPPREFLIVSMTKIGQDIY